MKQFILLIAMLISHNAFCQTTIYSENCNTPTLTTSVATYTGWQNYGTQTYSGNADVRTTVPSTGYTGASGGGNIFITNTVNTNCTISGINTTNYSNVCLQFGILKTTNGSNGSQLAVEYSTDGTTWTALSFILATGSGSSNVWTYIQPSCTPCGTTGLPSVSNLRIRFRMSSVVTGLQFRIDDIKLTGTYTGVVLPLSLSSFCAINSDGRNIVQWTTLSEDGLTSFVLERSSNLSEWEQLNTTTGSGDRLTKQQYSYVDDDPNTTVNYYRLHIYEEVDDYYSKVVGVVTHRDCGSARYYELDGTAVDGEIEPNKVYIKVQNGVSSKVIILETITYD